LWWSEWVISSQLNTAYDVILRHYFFRNWSTVEQLFRSKIFWVKFLWKKPNLHLPKCCKVFMFVHFKCECILYWWNWSICWIRKGHFHFCISLVYEWISMPVSVFECVLGYHLARMCAMFCHLLSSTSWAGFYYWEANTFFVDVRLNTNECYCTKSSSIQLCCPSCLWPI